MTMTQFLNRFPVKMDTTLVDSNPNMTDMPSGSTHWRCVLRLQAKRMTVYYSMGPAHCGEPTLANVLGALASDAISWENAPSFEEWASEFGYDTDSRKAERTYKAVEKQTEALARLLPPDAYNQLLWHTERV